MIRIENVSTVFGGGESAFTAVDNVTLSIPKGSIQGIIGFSGAGKSTLLRNINLLERPTSGRVLVDGTDLTSLGDAELRAARHEIGMIFQHFNLLNNRTAAQNVELSLKFAGVKNAAERRARALEALAVVDLSEKAGTYPAKLSGGQKQRVAIARALATRPKVLLCDEPTSAVDPRTTASVLQYLSDVNARFGITIVVVTHEMNVIKAIADNVAVMEEGRVVEQFALAELARPGFTPATAIGRYLISDEITLDRAAGREGARVA
ncbi:MULTISPECIES: methionine ABC transporter ATP-binding protein [unclassified Arthrobacter]|uniref:methionine ABC transporter ATP-binding protein n=1 Tax=unclassified Arthrobacter TaxID=235627 RepID=UPI0006DA5D73|nr:MULTISPECIES: methionine ABC transporter ATP-binding protein [unclassified Arthrobacter]KPN18138.1 ABC transporter [Arthrobacter sp. Edens01]MSR98964.1 ATP-binding cassette domain-containing protein [Arthrobacter sp. BL-252-APC-1A]